MNTTPKYETKDFPVRTVLLGSLGLAAMLVFFALLMWWMMFRFVARETRTSAPAHPLAQKEGLLLPPEPRLQVKPRQDLLALRAWEEETLGSYGWIDKPTGVVRVPIEQAMTLLLKQGLPSRPRTDTEGGK